MSTTAAPSELVDFALPSLGADMDEGTLLEWRVAVGQELARGDIVALIDTEKSEIEIETFHPGVVAELLLDVGETVPVGTVIARFSTPHPPTEATIGAPAPPEREAGGHVLGAALAGLRPGATPRRRRETSVEPTPVATSAPDERREAMRRRIGRQMARSKREIPHYYVAADIDLDVAMAWMRRHNETHDLSDRLVAASLLLTATARAAAAAPDLNGTWVDDAFVPAAAVHLGVAISLRGGGLVAPAILDAEDRPVTDLMAALRDLVARARAGRLRDVELRSPTITVTNLGEQGVELVHPIINPPQVAMVGFGRIADRPIALDGRVVVHPVVTASVSADHRVSDGIVAARFLTSIDRLLQRPEEL
ncbi:MAG: dihydrolipoamide acetyltransferase family protein [Actinomycetota bacterium]